MIRSAAILGLCLGLAAQALALDPLPFEQKGPGYRTWVVESDHPLVSLEVVLHDLRSTDRRTYLKMLKTLGLKQEIQGRGIAWPELVQPVEASAQFLGFERRKMAVVSAPVRGRHLWYAIVLRQEGNEEAYWRARQVFIFETDPVEGIKQGYPDVLGEDIHFWEVRHITQDDIFGRARVSSLFRYDERGRLRITFQEHADAYRPAKFQGESLRVDQTLVYKGDQKIVRKLVLTSYPFMKREEWEQYEGVDPKLAKPAKVQRTEEVFAWDPADFNFYGAAQELEKLAKHKSAYVRRDAARRLGEHLKTTHPGLEKALLTDKDAHVRMQAALALEAIADPAALPTVEKALTNYHEPDDVREALERAQRRLAPLVPKPEPKVEPAVKKDGPAKKKSGQEGELPKPEGPQVTEKK